MVQILMDMTSSYCSKHMVDCLCADDNHVRWGAATILGRLAFFGASKAFLERWPIEEDWDVQVAMLATASKDTVRG